MARNKNLIDAKVAKNDKFYTLYADIAMEVVNYRNDFINAVVYCPCDEPGKSKFFEFFVKQLYILGIKKLICSCWNGLRDDSLSKGPCLPGLLTPTKQAVYIEIEWDDIKDCVKESGEVDFEFVITQIKPKALKGNGSYRSEELLRFFIEADIIVTNPPFSELAEFIKYIVKLHKRFLVIGNLNTIMSSTLFPLFKDGKVCLGYRRRAMKFIDGASGDKERLKTFGFARLFTNLPVVYTIKESDTFFKYDPIDYSKFANLNAIDVDASDRIPDDFDEIMAVPITYLDNFDHNKFEILGNNMNARWLDPLGVNTLGVSTCVQLRKQGNKGHYSPNMKILYIQRDDGTIVIPYSRILIKRKTQFSNNKLF